MSRTNNHNNNLLDSAAITVIFMTTAMTTDILVFLRNMIYVSLKDGLLKVKAGKVVTHVFRLKDQV